MLSEEEHTGLAYVGTFVLCLQVLDQLEAIDEVELQRDGIALLLFLLLKFFRIVINIESFYKVLRDSEYFFQDFRRN